MTIFFTLSFGINYLLQLGEQTAGIRDQCALARLQSHCSHLGVLGLLTWLE